MKDKPDLTPIATKSGLSLSYISRVFSGDRIPRVHYFKKIADAMGLSMDTLYYKLKDFYEVRRK
jgi:transcriptional regulator with XRE-family HTH domain